MARLNINKNNVTAILEEYLMSNDPITGQSESDIAERISKRCNIDLSIWSITDIGITGNLWTVNGKFGEGKTKHWKEAKNRQLKVLIRYKRIAPDNKDQFKDELMKYLKAKSPRKQAFKNPIQDGACLLTDVPDHHLARLSYGKETGDNYDIVIAQARFENATNYFIDEALYMHKRKPIQEIIFPFGNDYFNYDHAKPFPQTSNGTPQESDVRHQKMFYVGSSMAVSQIERASEIAPVKVFIVPGNHDEQIAFYLGQVLHAWFRNNKRVTVEISPTLRKYHQHGKNMLGFSHGQYESFERLFANMAFEEMKMWGATTYKYMYTGHKHHKETKVRISQTLKEVRYPSNPVTVTEDLNGVMFDRLGSLTSNDYYESSRGYIHIKGAEAFLFDKELGKMHSFSYQLPISIHPDNR